MTAIRKTAAIAKLIGIEISDPAYTKRVSCRYENTVMTGNVQLELIAERDDEAGYPFTEFTVLIQPLIGGKARIKIADDQTTLYRPQVYGQREFEIGMDSANIYMGQRGGCRKALCTGTDGLFGTVLEFTYKGRWVGTVLEASIDECFATEDSLWEYLKESFQAVEWKGGRPKEREERTR